MDRTIAPARSMNGARPLVTFALFAYNQERFIREAVEGALGQTYSPLEIILSDDCSTDSTYRCMQEMAEAYRGPHKLVLNRTERNLGLGQHINSVFALSHGEFVVVAAGDDVSLPERTTVLVDFWNARGRPTAISSETIAINEYGAEISQTTKHKSYAEEKYSGKADVVSAYLTGSLPMALGCSAAYSRKVFDVFGSLPDALISEDYVLSLRAWFLEGVACCDERLVRYRSHGGSLTNRPMLLRNKADPKSLKQRFLEEELSMKPEVADHVASMYDSARRDLVTAERLGLADGKTCLRLQRILSGKKSISLLHAGWWYLGGIARIVRFLAVLPTLLSDDFQVDRGKLKWMLPRVIGLNLFCSAKAHFRRDR